MVTLALRCLFVIGLGTVVATDWAKVIAVFPSTIVVLGLSGDSVVVVPGVVVVLELSGISVVVLLSCSVLIGVKTHLTLWSVTP